MKNFIIEMWNLKIGRKRYIVSTLLLSAFIFISAMIFGSLKMDTAFVFTYLATGFVSVFINKQRLNDLGKSGWYILFFLVPVANILLFLYLLFKKGDNNTEVAINK